MCFNSGEQDTQDYDKASFLMTKTIFYMAWHRSESVQQNEYIYIYILILNYNIVPSSCRNNFKVFSDR